MLFFCLFGKSSKSKIKGMMMIMSCHVIPTITIRMPIVAIAMANTPPKRTGTIVSICVWSIEA